MNSVAVIGCGYWGKNLVRKFHELGVLSAVSDPDPEVKQRLKDQYGVESKTTDEIWADKSIDCVVVAVPAEMHHDITIKAFAAGKHVFVEKPIALTLHHAQEMIDAAEAADKTLMVGHLLQYHPVFLKLKEMVRNGDFGKLRYVYSRRLNIGKLRTHENVLWSFAPHDISMILALIGAEPDRTIGFAGNFLQETISDFASVQMEFPGGEKAHVDVSWLNPFKEQRLVIAGDKCMAEFNDQEDWSDKLKIYRHKAEIINGEPVLEPAQAESIIVDSKEPLLNECEHFLHFVNSGERPYTDGHEALKVLRVLRAGDVAVE